MCMSSVCEQVKPVRRVQQGRLDLKVSWVPEEVSVPREPLDRRECRVPRVPLELEDLLVRGERSARLDFLE